MRTIFLYVFVISATSCSRKLPPPPVEAWVDISNCNFYNDYNSRKRLKRKPFGQSAKTELVSFDAEFEEKLDSIVYKDCCRDKIPQKDSKIDRSQLKEIIRLTPMQLDSLTNIFFNFDYGRAENGIYRHPKVACYKPRHALLFFRNDADNEPFAYFEICFQCQDLRTFPRNYEVGNFCEGKFDLLRDFFRQAGITQGFEK